MPNEAECGFTAGLPLVAELGFRPLPNPIVALGAQAFANINTIAVFRGWVLLLQLGWMP
jgi:hypothetical protein